MDVPFSVTINSPEVRPTIETLSPSTSSTTASSASMLNNAENTLIKNSSFSITTNTTNYNTNNGSAADLSLEILYRSAAPNAILNSGGRADEVRCYPGTREEVLDLVEKSINGRGDSGPRMLWLSGPAGAGKTAIMQTVAERCKQEGIPQANFFFFRVDRSRNSASPVVATLMYQIIKLYPSLGPPVAAALESDPLLLQLSLHQQFDTLLHQTFPTVHDASSDRRPLALFIDGLDECDSEDKTAQRKLLQALDALVVQKGQYFRVVVASRVEPQISMAFKQLQSQVDSIFLDEQYSPENDIRLFVTAEFEKIKLTHHLAHTLSSDWPSDSDIGGIVSKSSGHFIFAATAIRFIAHSSASPVLSLQKVQGIVPSTKNTPFAQLDAIYTYILQQVEDLEAVQSIFAIKFLECDWLSEIRQVMEAYRPRFSAVAVDSCTSELSPLVDTRNGSLKFFHASLSDFLRDKSRAKECYIDLEAFSTEIFPILWAPERDGYLYHVAIKAIGRHVQQPTPDITAALMNPRPIVSMMDNSDYNFSTGERRYSLWALDALISDLDRIYFPHDPQSFVEIGRTWMAADPRFAGLFPFYFLSEGGLQTPDVSDQAPWYTQGSVETFLQRSPEAFAWWDNTQNASQPMVEATVQPYTPVINRPSEPDTASNESPPPTGPSSTPGFLLPRMRPLVSDGFVGGNADDDRRGVVPHPAPIGKRSTSPFPSAKSDKSEATSPPPNLVLPSWQDTFHTPPRNVLPPKPEVCVNHRGGGGKLLGKAMKFVTNAMFLKDKGPKSITSVPSIGDASAGRRVKGREREASTFLGESPVGRDRCERFQGWGTDLPKAWHILEEAGYDTSSMGPGHSSSPFLPSKQTRALSNSSPAMSKPSHGVTTEVQVETKGINDALKGCRRVVVIGVHGWFPGELMRTVLGESTGTSPKLADMMERAVFEFAKEHEATIEKITKIPLESEGTIETRVESVYSDLKMNESWMNDLYGADVVMLATHSQGSIVSTHLLDRLIRDNHIITPQNQSSANSVVQVVRTGAGLSPLTVGMNRHTTPSSRRRVQRICFLALCGTHHGPHRYLDSSTLVGPYVQNLESAASQELFEFENTESAVSQAYIAALQHVLDHGTKIVHIASLDDRVVPIHSGLFTAVTHPLILRAIYIDGDTYHSSKFLSTLLALLLRIRNAGIPDPGLLAHLSDATAGLFNGIGHWTVSEELATFSLAVKYLFLANDGIFEQRKMTIHPINAPKKRNDYEIPWLLRDIIADERVAHFFSRDITELQDAFQEWHPKTSMLRDLKRKLQPIELLSSSFAALSESQNL